MYDIGRSKRASHAYEFDQVAIVPARRTRGTEEVNLTWRIDAITLEFPMVAAPMDSVILLVETLAAAALRSVGRAW